MFELKKDVLFTQTGSVSQITETRHTVAMAHNTNNTGHDMKHKENKHNNTCLKNQHNYQLNIIIKYLNCYNLNFSKYNKNPKSKKYKTQQQQCWIHHAGKM